MKPQRLTLFLRGTSGDRAGERGINRSTSSPRPSPPSNGGEGEIRKLSTTSNRTSLVGPATAQKREDVRQIHFVSVPSMPWSCSLRSTALIELPRPASRIEGSRLLSLRQSLRV